MLSESRVLHRERVLLLGLRFANSSWQAGMATILRTEFKPRPMSEEKTKPNGTKFRREIFVSPSSGTHP